MNPSQRQLASSRQAPSHEALAELMGSRAALRDVLGRETEVFAYPFSNQSPAVRQLAREAGYRAAVRGKGRMNWPASMPGSPQEERYLPSPVNL